MNQLTNLIYELKTLKKVYKEQTVINISRLQFHRGTIYGVVGPIGSGKSTLLKIMSGLLRESSGSLKYDNNPFEMNLFGRVKPNPAIKLVQLDDKIKFSTISKLFQKTPADLTLKKHFNNPARTLKNISKGEKALLSLLSAFELDPRVLLIDDYGICFNDALEKEICKKIKSMNKEFGTTIVLSAPSDTYLKKLASVLIYLDNGHISKIRSGISARSSKNIQQKNQNSTKRRRKFIKKKPKR